MTGDEARHKGPWEGERREAQYPLPRFSFRPPLRTNLHLATILISDVLRVRVSSC